MFFEALLLIDEREGLSLRYSDRLLVTGCLRQTVDVKKRKEVESHRKERYHRK